MASDNAQKPPHTAAAHTPLHLRIYCTEHPSRIFPDRMAAGRPGKPEVPTNTYVRKKQPLPLSSRPERPCPLFFRLLSPEELRNTAAAARTMSPITLKSRRVLSHPAAQTVKKGHRPQKQHKFGKRTARWRFFLFISPKCGWPLRGAYFAFCVVRLLPY